MNDKKIEIVKDIIEFLQYNIKDINDLNAQLKTLQVIECLITDFDDIVALKIDNYFRFDVMLNTIKNLIIYQIDNEKIDLISNDLLLIRYNQLIVALKYNYNI